VCHSKHVQPSINFGIINSIAKLHLVGISTEILNVFHLAGKLSAVLPHGYGKVTSSKQKYP
jgi:hypothetical protein